MATGSVPPNNDKSQNVELDFLKRKSSSFLNQIHNAKQLLSVDNLKELSEEELCTHLELLDEQKTDFERNQYSLEKLDVNEIGSAARSSFNANYIILKSAFRKEVNHRQGPPGLNSTARHHFGDDRNPSFIIAPPKTRLPVLQIPKFGGSYTEWPNFISMFTTIVHNEEGLTKIEKLQHLRSSLKDSALDAIRSLEITEANYDQAISILKSRYDNKRLNFQAHIKDVFGLKRSENGTANQLRELNDKFYSNYRALQTMATKEEIADGLLIHLITNLFDTKTKMKWEEETPMNILPQLDSLLKFWEKRCQMLENVENAMPTEKPSNKVDKKSSSSNRKTLVVSTSKNCAFCGASDHSIYQCKTFVDLDPSLRFNEVKKLQLCINCLKRGHFLKNCKSSNCRQCTAMHHSLLHGAKPIANSSDDTSTIATTNVGTSLISTSCIAENCLVTGSNSLPSNVVLLATAVVFIKDKFGSLIPCRAVLDSASQVHCVTSRFANTLQLTKIKTATGITGFGQSNFIADSAIEIELHSRSGKYSSTLVAVITPAITDNQPNCTLNNIDWKIPGNIQLADPSFHKSQRIDMLIGAGLFFDLLCVGQIRISPDLPVLQKTRLGWVVCGGNVSNSQTASCLSVIENNSSEIPFEASLDQLVKGFWEVENCFSSSAKATQEELDCEKHFTENYTRLCSGEYAVRLPFKKDPNQLGDSYANAIYRFKNLEKRLSRNPSLKLQYSGFMAEYEQLGHMSSVPKFPTGVPAYFLPHHCVLKADSSTTKLRVVFDGSARASSGLSLNEILMAGPTIQPKLFETLLRFRTHYIALTGDIAKMYRCVRISDPDSYMQCILWREDCSEPIRIYKLDTITYGTKPASFLAIRAMQQLASDERKNYPVGAATVYRDFYVDDLLTGCDSVEDVIELKRQTTELLSKGNFHIRKWCTNSHSVLEKIPESDRESFLKFHDGTDIKKTLGLCWDPETDKFLFSLIPQKPSKKITKRSVLSIIARIYDPLGLIGPVITRAKIFLQRMWKERLDWDESLPMLLQENWHKICLDFDGVAKCAFPRHVLAPKGKVSVHAFCDASQDAYGACIYTVVQEDGNLKSNLLCSKSRVAPLKALTIPKLELSAALLLAELVKTVFEMNSFGSDFHCWSDSTIVLGWLNETSSNFNVFVSNRISKIQSLTKGMPWRHVPTNLNPADVLSRGASPKELHNSPLWNFGPNFLGKASDQWPQINSVPLELPERRKNVLSVCNSTVDYSLTCKFLNSFPKLQRTYAYIYKFQQKRRGCLSQTDLKGGTVLLIRMIQKTYFSKEYRALEARNCITGSSVLSSLNPFVDSAGVIRVGGRLTNSTLDFEAKHPIILPKRHPITDAIVNHFHRQLRHAGPQSLLTTLRLQYWPLGGKHTVSRVINKCVTCFRAKPTLYQHIMGNLPAERVQANRVFLVTGIDFCGPFYYKTEIRNRPPIKCYICLFICFSTKAVHLEISRDLTTQSFLAALKRFVSLRGKPKTIWSDNATNFVGAKNELAELHQLFQNEQHKGAVLQQCLNDGIDWQFIPPRSPHFGGLWEASIKSFKHHFTRTIGCYIPTYDELHTLVYQICAILNSRPLFPLSESPESLDVLTPAHFLVGSPLTAVAEPDVSSLNIGRLDRWQQITRMHQVFWQKWSSAYLTHLQERSKWHASSSNLPIGSMVLIRDEGEPTLKWPLARVLELIKGHDGVGRVAVLRTAKGITRRATSKLCLLPIEDSSVERLNLPMAGVCSEISA